MVARRGKLVHFEAFGKADVEADKPMRKDAIFRIYSMTKPITTVAAMMLYEEGKFQLGDSLSDYLPQFAAVEVYRDGGNESPHRPITVRDLLTHRSGLTYGLFSGTPVDKLYRESNVLDSSGTLKDMVDKLAAIPLLNQPGQKWHYSVSTDVLGYLVEVLSGQPLDEFFQQRIFDPLAMTDTGFYVPMGKKDRFPVNYVWNGEGERRVADHPATSRYLKKPTFHSGGGGLVSTTVDYMRFCQMLLSGGQLDGVRLLSPKTVEIMTMNHLDDAQTPNGGVTLGNGAGFGLGFRVVTDVPRNERTVSTGTYGWGGMASTMFFIDPHEELIGIIMSQKLPTYLRIRDEFQAAVYQSITELSGS
jgi:CubicO group peptidase (beta-lactamase class C family)